MTFGERLKKLRQEKEITQSMLGELIGVSARMISFYESDMHFPKDAQSLIKLAQYFKVSLDYLLGMTNDRNYDNFTQFNKNYNKLPDKGKLEVEEYILFLLQKYKLKK